MVNDTTFQRFSKELFKRPDAYCCLILSLPVPSLKKEEGDADHLRYETVLLLNGNQ